MPSTPSAAVQHAQSMIQDYNQALVPEIADTLQNCFMAVPNPNLGNTTELVTLNAQNGLMWLYPDQSSLTGWDHTTSEIFSAPTDPTTGQPQNPDRLLSFYQRDVLYVFAEFPGASSSQLLGMQWTQKGEWAAAEISQADQQYLSAMGQSNLLIDSDGTGYLYGVNNANVNQPMALVFGYDPGGQGLHLIYQNAVANLNSQDAEFILLPGSQAGEFIILTLSASTANFQPVSMQGGGLKNQGSGSTQTLDIPGQLQVDTVVPVPNGLTKEPTFLLLSQDQQLYAVIGNGLNGGATATAQPLTGGTNQPPAVSSVSAGTEAGGNFAVFAIDATTSRLWTYTQPAEAGGYPWTLLGNNVLAMTAPFATAGGSQVLLCSPSLVISSLTQSQATASWFQLPIMAPSPPQQPIAETSTYTQQFSFTDAATGVPLSNAPILIKSNPQQVVIINAIAYHASPSQPVTVLTDAFGQLTVATMATGLASPVLTLSSSSSSSSSTAAVQGSYRGDLQLHQRIAGQNIGQSPLQITGPWLIQNGILPANTSSSDAANYASTMTSLSGCAVNMATGSSSTAQTTPWTVLIGVNQNQLQCQQVTREDFARFVSAADSAIADVWGDVANFCKNAWHDVENIAVSIGKDTAQIAVKLYNGTKHFVLTTIEDIRDALESMIAFIAKLAEDAYKLIKDFIDLLKLLFDWGNIKNTKTVIEYFVTQLLNDMQDNTAAAQAWLTNKFSQTNQDVDKFFDYIAGIVDPTLTFGQAAATQSVATAPVQASINANAIQSNYAWSKVLTAAPTTGEQQDVPAENPAIKAFMQEFAAVFESSEGDLEQAWTAIVAAAQQIKSVSSFLDFVIVAFLQACEAFIKTVMKLVEAFLQTVLGVMVATAQYIAGRLTQTIEVPVLSALYKFISGGPMSLLDMTCLAIAIPVTVIYEIANGGNGPFDSGAVAKITSNPVLWPWSPGFSMGGGNSDAITSGSALQVVLSWTATAAGLCYTACDMFCDIANVAMTDSDTKMKKMTAWVSTLAVILDTAATAAAAPWFAPAPAQSTAAGWQLGSFAAAFPPLISDMLFLQGTGYLLRFGPDPDVGNVVNLGPTVSSVLGAAQVAVGSVAAYTMGHDADGATYTGWDKTSVVLSGFSNLGKSLVYLGAGGDDAGVAAAILGLCAFDFAGDLGGALTNLFATYD